MSAETAGLSFTVPEDAQLITTIPTEISTRSTDSDVNFSAKGSNAH